jgi:hypothetical protein
MFMGKVCNSRGIEYMVVNPPGNMSLCLGNTLAATIFTSVNNFINLAKCT